MKNVLLIVSFLMTTSAFAQKSATIGLKCSISEKEYMDVGVPPTNPKIRTLSSFDLGGDNGPHALAITSNLGKGVSLIIRASITQRENESDMISFESGFVFEPNLYTTYVVDAKQISFPIDKSGSHLTVSTLYRNNLIVLTREYTVACDPLN